MTDLAQFHLVVWGFVPGAILGGLIAWLVLWRTIAVMQDEIDALMSHEIPEPIEQVTAR